MEHSTDQSYPEGGRPVDEPPVTGLGRQRTRTPSGERSQRMHRFSATLLAALDDATAGGVENLAVGCLNAREAGETVLELRETIARLHGLELGVLAHADAREVCKAVEGPAAVDTAGWLSHAGLLAGRTARAEVKLSGNLSGTCTATGSALLAGDIDVDQAHVIVWALGRLPETVSAEQRAEAEKTLLNEALRLDAVQLRRAGHRLLEVIDPDAAEAAEAERIQKEEDAAAARTSFTSYDDGDGATQIWATVPTRHTDMLRTALHAIINPALAEAVARTRTLSDPGTGLHIEAPRPTAQVMGEGFCRLIETLDPSKLPSTGGLNATVIVTISMETLRGGLATATMDTGTDLSPGEARRMACEGGLLPAVLGAQSQILDFGRARRLFSKAQRAVMALRQGFRCAAEGCDRPTAWCDAHHLTHWNHHGNTDLDDGVLICGRHHRLAHHPDYQLTRSSTTNSGVIITRKPRESPRRH